MDDEIAPENKDMDLYLFLKSQLETYSCFKNPHKLQHCLEIAENALNQMEDPLAREMLRQEIAKYKG